MKRLLISLLIAPGLATSAMAQDAAGKTPDTDFTFYLKSVVTDTTFCAINVYAVNTMLRPYTYKLRELNITAAYDSTKLTPKTPFFVINPVMEDTAYAADASLTWLPKGLTAWANNNIQFSDSCMADTSAAACSGITLAYNTPVLLGTFNFTNTRPSGGSWSIVTLDQTTGKNSIQVSDGTLNYFYKPENKRTKVIAASVQVRVAGNVPTSPGGKTHDPPVVAP